MLRYLLLFNINYNCNIFYMLRKPYLIGGALALFAASLGFIALNIESISKLASPEVENILDDSQNLLT